MDSKATGSGNDQTLMQFSAYDISDHKDKLRKGENILAIHGMNNSEQSSDLLFVAELQTNDYDLEKEIWKLIDEEAFYTFWTVEGLLSFWDGYSGNRNNFFVYLTPRPANSISSLGVPTVCLKIQPARSRSPLAPLCAHRGPCCPQAVSNTGRPQKICCKDEETHGRALGRGQTPC